MIAVGHDGSCRNRLSDGRNQAPSLVAVEDANISRGVTPGMPGTESVSDFMAEDEGTAVDVASADDRGSVVGSSRETCRACPLFQDDKTHEIRAQ